MAALPQLPCCDQIGADPVRALASGVTKQKRSPKPRHSERPEVPRIKRLSETNITKGEGNANSRRERSASLIGGIGVSSSTLAAGTNSRFIDRAGVSQP